MNYEIIKDEKLFREFIDWLPVCLPHEQYYVCLFARSKYCKELVHIKSDKAQLKRFTSTKERLFQKVKQLECEVGSYMQRDVKIPQEALALYITLNPRDLWKATFSSLVKMSKLIQDDNRLNNPYQEVLSEIQRTKGSHNLVNVDIDTKDVSVLHTALSNINKEAVQILETRGGYHLIITPGKVTPQYKNVWYKSIMSMEEVDQMGDNMIPVPGCTQGNFVPKFI